MTVDISTTNNQIILHAERARKCQLHTLVIRNMFQTPNKMKNEFETRTVQLAHVDVVITYYYSAYELGCEFT